MEKSQQTHIQAQLFDFALMDLVCRHRESFEPLWTVDSWVKFLIWMTLNCGLSGEKESIELFIEALGTRLTTRMRKCFFERNLERFALQIMADPSESKVLVVSLTNSLSVNIDEVQLALEKVGIVERVELDQRFWQKLDGVIALPWRSLGNKV